MWFYWWFYCFSICCLQIPWVDDPDRIKAWEESRTGYPWYGRPSCCTARLLCCTALPVCCASRLLSTAFDAARDTQLPARLKSWHQGR